MNHAPPEVAIRPPCRISENPGGQYPGSHDSRSEACRGLQCIGAGKTPSTIDRRSPPRCPTERNRRRGRSDDEGRRAHDAPPEAKQKDTCRTECERSHGRCQRQLMGPRGCPEPEGGQGWRGSSGAPRDHGRSDPDARSSASSPAAPALAGPLPARAPRPAGAARPSGSRIAALRPIPVDAGHVNVHKWTLRAAMARLDFLFT